MSAVAALPATPPPAPLPSARTRLLLEGPILATLLIGKVRSKVLARPGTRQSSPPDLETLGLYAAANTALI